MYIKVSYALANYWSLGTWTIGRPYSISPSLIMTLCNMGNLDNLPFNLTDSLIYMQGLCEPTEWLNLDATIQKVLVWVKLAETALFLQRELRQCAGIVPYKSDQLHPTGEATHDTGHSSIITGVICRITWCKISYPIRSYQRNWNWNITSPGTKARNISPARHIVLPSE